LEDCFWGKDVVTCCLLIVIVIGCHCERRTTDLSNPNVRLLYRIVSPRSQ
jgi:hypothetical protein